MKKRILLLPLLAVGLLAGCGENPKPEGNVLVESVELSETQKNIEIGEKFNLSATVKPDNATNKKVTWTSSNESVAKYNAGVVEGLTEGNTNITVTTEDQNKTATCSVTVFKKGELVHVTGVTLDFESVELKKGGTKQLVATVAPADATDKTVSWDSDDDSVATVDNGKIKAISVGKCIISVSTNDLGFTAFCEVTVTEEVEPDPEETQTLVYNVKENGESQFKLSSPITKDFLTFTFDQATGSNQPMYNYVKSGKHGMFRLYPNTTMKITSTKPLEKIEIGFYDNEIGLSVDKGTYSAGVWAGSECEITFTAENKSSGHVDFEVMTFTYIDKVVPHTPIDLGVKTIKEVKDYIAANPVDTNSHQCGVDEYTTVTIKGYALAKISLIKTVKAYGLNVSEPSKIIMGDKTDAIGCATKTGDGSFFNKVNDHQMKSTSRYTVSGYISIYLGQPEIVVTAFSWDEKLDVELDVDKISKENITITQFYEKAAAVNYNCAGHGYGETYTIKGLTCYYDESAGQGKDWYNFTDGTNNIRVNAYNLGSVSVGYAYDVTGIISLQSLSPIIVAFKIAPSSATPVDVNEFYKSAKTQSVTDLLKIKGSQDDTDTRYPDVVNSYSQISKATGYMCIVEENGKLYVGFSDKYLGENFLVGKDNAKANYGVTLIKNDGFWNTTEEKLYLFNVYYDVMRENEQVTIYYVNRQLGYKEKKPMWEILLIPQSIPVVEAE